jgi:4-amino-4-deoxy-L-arabinose transferase-like glycosyltransferase
MVTVDLGRRVLATNDEARFPVLAQDILARGAWLVPQLNGQPYLNKPPLMAWLIAIVSWPVGGVSQLTAAVPPALAAVAAALVVYLIGRDLFDRAAGYGAALVALTTQGFVEFARVPVPDMLMTLAMTTSLWMLVRLVREPRAAWWLGFYGFAALAFWAKGPAGLLPLAVALAWTLAARTQAWRALRLGPGAVVVAVLIAPYWIGGLTASAAGVRRAVMTDQLAWYVPAAVSPQVLLAPFGHALGILVPWILVVPIAVMAAVRWPPAAMQERRGLTLVVAWAAVVFVLIAI